MKKVIRSEQKIREKEMIESEAPRSVKGFEKALLASPYSSYLWIRYAAFHIDNDKLDLARQTIERGIQQIDPCEEREKLNLYISWINIEEHFGTEDTLDNVTKQALLTNNPEEIYRHLARKHPDPRRREKYHETLCRKFPKNIDNWTLLCEFYLNDNQRDAFEEVYQKALQSCQGNIELVKKVGLLEFKFGNFEQGRNIFEELIASKPKRSDIWNIYINAEVKYSAVERVRELYQRVLTIKFKSSVNQSFKKAYIEFEQSKGSKNIAKMFLED